MVKSAMRKIGSIRVARYRVYDHIDVLRRCFCSFILPSLEQCSAIWSSATIYLCLIEWLTVRILCVVQRSLCIYLFVEIFTVCVYSIKYIIIHNFRHPLNDVSAPSGRVRLTRAGVIVHRFELQLRKCPMAQF